jgi:hypothetical protein
MRHGPVIGLAVGAVSFVGTAVLLSGMLVLGGAPWSGGSCDVPLDGRAVPAALVPLFDEAATKYALGPDGPAVLAALTSVESDFGRNVGPSSAGAIGWTQFMPGTWARFGVDADGDGRRDPMNAADAIESAANYLRHLGAPDDWSSALFGYNHSDAYVTEVLGRAAAFAQPGAASRCGTAVASRPEAVQRVIGGGRIVAIQGQPGQSIDERILPDVEWLIRRYRVAVTAGYALTGHAADGEHPLGLAVDLVPGPRGTWDDVDALARWAEPRQDHPRAPFRWVGYDGDPGHGRGNHLHLSWQHGPASFNGRAAWVLVFLESQ